MAKIFHASLHGLSKAKDLALLASDIDKTEWSDIDLEASEFYLLIPQSYDLRTEYDRGWKVTDIFPVNSVGIVTGQDAKTITAKKADAELLAAERKLSISTVKPILYQPFDIHHIVYDSTVVTRPRLRVMQHMLAGENLGLLISRQVISEFRHIFVSENISNFNALDTAGKFGTGPFFPLYLYPTTQAEKDMGIKCHPNIAPEFLTKLKQNLGYVPTPEAIFHYIYAIFHSPKYRSRYAEFLKIDFPRVPLTRNVDLFRQLGKLGEQLVNLHLMKSPILNETSSPFINNGGGCIVEHPPKYESGKVVINKQKDGFMDVPEAVWSFHVGGYQVCHKWLKDRKGRILSQDDIEHYQKIVVALGQSIKLMKQIDEAIPSWPIDAEYN
jgi:Type ISP C-terminal specificity domain